MRVQGLAIGFALLVTSAVSSPAQAKPPRPEEGSLVALSVALESKPKFRLSIESGQQARLDLDDSDRHFAILPFVDPGTPGVVKLRLLEVRQVPGKGEALRQIEKFDLRPGVPHSTATQPRWTFELQGVRPIKGGDEKPWSPLARKTSDTRLTVGLQVASGAPATARVLEGEMLFLEASGRALGVLPEVLDNDRVEFRVYRLASKTATAQEARQIDRFILGNQGEFTSRTDPPFVLSLKEVRRPR